MTLTTFNLIKDEIYRLEGKLKEKKTALKKARKAGIDDWWVGFLEDGIGWILCKLEDLKEDLKRLRGHG